MEHLPQVRRPGRDTLRRAAIWVAGLWCLGAAAAVEIEVDGVGWIADARIASVIGEVLFPGQDEEVTQLRAFDVEDAVLVLSGELRDRGYLDPTITVWLWAGEEAKEPLLSYVWNPATARDLPDLSAVTRLELRVEKGVRSFFEEVTFSGLQAISPEDAQLYFYTTGTLFVLRAERAYSPDALNRGIGSLVYRLAELGYQEAQVTPVEIDRNPESGATRVALRVVEGPLYRWAEVRYAWAPGVEPAEGVELPAAGPPEGPYNRDAQQDLAVELRNRFLEAGYPDVRVRSSRNLFLQEDGSKTVELDFEVVPGPRVRVAAVEFDGLDDTSRRFAVGKTGLEAGDWLSRVGIDEARSRLGRLGIFDEITVSLVPPDDPEARTIRFEVEEGLRREVNLLFGYGSYEQLRVGVEGRFYNLFGRAHQGRVRLHQSMKSTAAQVTYAVPDLPTFLERGQARLQGLRREEVSFTREEAAVSVGLEHTLFDDDVSLTAEYSLQILRTLDLETEEETGDERARVGSIILGFAWDRRDRVVFPREGFDLRSELELASPGLGAEANFQRLIVGTSYHFTINQGAIGFHFGLEHGVFGRAFAEEGELPFNKRFFPGGENSIRGYQEGEASPLGSSGETIGAATYLLGHAEVEFAILRSLSVVLFVDGLHQAQSLDDYPGNTTLWSAGGGIRYDTPLGPLRLEYGHNLTPRDFDPSGTLHFSIGFPF